MRLLGVKLCGSISPESLVPCVLNYDDPHVGGHVALLKPALSAGWWYGDERDACERSITDLTATDEVTALEEARDWIPT